MKRLAFGLAGEKLHAVQHCGDLDVCLKASRGEEEKKKEGGGGCVTGFSLRDKTEGSLHKTHTSNISNKTCSRMLFLFGDF